MPLAIYALTAGAFGIAAFNLGNAIGAWAGGAVIDHGPGLSFVPLVAALFPVAAIAVAYLNMRQGAPRAMTRTIAPEAERV